MQPVAVTGATTPRYVRMFWTISILFVSLSGLTLVPPCHNAQNASNIHVIFIVIWYLQWCCIIIATGVFTFRRCSIRCFMKLFASICGIRKCIPLPMCHESWHLLSKHKTFDYQRPNKIMNNIQLIRSTMRIREKLEHATCNMLKHLVKLWLKLQAHAIWLGHHSGTCAYNLQVHYAIVIRHRCGIRSPARGHNDLCKSITIWKHVNKHGNHLVLLWFDGNRLSPFVRTNLDYAINLSFSLQ